MAGWPAALSAGAGTAGGPGFSLRGRQRATAAADGSAKETPMNRNRWTAPALLALVLATPALAGPGPGGYPRHGDDRRGPGGPGPMFDPDVMEELFDARADRLAELLDLTADQRAAFDQARTDALES